MIIFYFLFLIKIGLFSFVFYQSQYQIIYQKYVISYIFCKDLQQTQQIINMRSSSPFARDRSPNMFQRKRSISPNNYATTNRTSNSSIKSQHLWQSLEQIQLFPQQFAQVLKHQQRNLNSFKKRIERQKNKVNQQFDALKRQIIHNIQDLKLSVQAQLDRVYRVFMQKYAVFKSQILEIKRLRQQIQTDLALKRMTPSSGRSLSPNNKLHKGSNVSLTSNGQLVKSIQNGQTQFRKYHIVNYIAQLQKEKIYPLNDLCKQIIILNQYENGYFRIKEFNHLINNLKQNFRDNLRYTYEKKFQFMRDPDYLINKDQRPVLQGVYQEQPLIREVPKKHVVSYPNKPQPFIKDHGIVSNSQQITTVQWCQEMNISYQGNLKTIQFSDIILCGIEVRKNQIAIGGKDGTLIIYDPSTGNKVTTLKGHKSSICSLAMINFQGRRILASGSDHGCSSIILWDIDSWTPKLKLQGHKYAVTCILDLGDGVHIASGSYDKKINVYNMIQGKVVYNLPTNKSSVTGIVLSARGTKMVSCGLDNSLNVWQIVRNKQNLIETMFLQRIIQNNTMICSFVGSMIQDHIMYIGTKDGKIKLINIQKGEAYKTLACCNNAIIQMLIIERQSKPDHPIALCWPGKQQSIKIVNCQSGKITPVSIKGFIQFGCGVGPKSFILNTGKSFGMVSQSQERKQVSFYKLQPQA